MQMSLAREINENKGQSWAVVAAAGITAAAGIYGAKKKHDSEKSAAQKAKDAEKHRLKQEKRLIKEERNATMITQTTQQSKGLALPDVSNPNLIYWGLGGIAILMVFLMGKR